MNNELMTDVKWADIYRNEFKFENDVMKLQDAFRIKMSLCYLLAEMGDEFKYKNGFSEKVVNQMINFALQEGERRGKKRGYEEGYEQARQNIIDRLSDI